MKKIKKQYLVKDKNNKIIKRITEVLVVNKYNETFKLFNYSSSVNGFRFFDKNSKKEVPRFILFYKNLTTEELLQKYDRIEITEKKPIN